MRVFYGIALPEPVREALLEAATHANEHFKGRFVLPASYHCTLAFIGNIPEDQRAALEGILKAVADHTPICVLTLTAPGTFGNKILWHGLKGVQPLGAASLALRVSLGEHGFNFDNKPFHPHITLARQVRMEPGTLAFAQARTVSWEVKALTLFESCRQGSSMIYQPLASCPTRL